MTDRQTDQPTNQPTDGRTDKAGCRVVHATKNVLARSILIHYGTSFFYLFILVSHHFLTGVKVLSFYLSPVTSKQIHILSHFHLPRLLSNDEWIIIKIIKNATEN